MKNLHLQAKLLFWLGKRKEEGKESSFAIQYGSGAVVPAFHTRTHFIRAPAPCKRNKARKCFLREDLGSSISICPGLVRIEARPLHNDIAAQTHF